MPDYGGRGNGKTDAMLAKLATFPTLRIVAHGDRVADLVRRGVDRDRIIVIDRNAKGRNRP